VRALWLQLSALRGRFAGHAASAVAISAVQQLVGFVRHALIAAFFGLSREFDGYLVVYAVAAMFIFNLSLIYDTTAVSRLVQIRERDGDTAFWRTSNRMLLQSVVGGALCAIAILLLLWLTIPIVTAGFTDSERGLVENVAKFFVPWIAVIIPFYAVSAHLKALWQFQWVFGAELAAMIISIGVLVANHQHISDLPIAYGCGYAGALVLLLLKRGIRRPGTAAKPHDLLRGMFQQYLAIQIGNATGLADRFFQSYVVPGGISALGYSSLIVNSLSSLLTFREIYVVPLASHSGREARLERIVQGMVFISIPCMAFLVVHAERIVELLLQRGAFTSEATAVTSAVLRIHAFSLIFSTIVAPLERMFQVLDRLALTQIRYGVSFIATIVFSYVFIFHLGMDIRGVASAWLCNSIVVFVIVIALLRHCSIVLRWRGIALGAALATGITAVAGAVSFVAAAFAAGLAGLVLGAIAYGAVMGAGYLVIRRRLLGILG